MEVSLLAGAMTARLDGTELGESPLAVSTANSSKVSVASISASNSSLSRTTMFVLSASPQSGPKSSDGL